MCPNRDWFTTYKAIEGASVLMGNNVVCKIVGIGTVRIKCHDGIVRTLTDVRHIPDLKKNLISLSTLNSIGCSYTGGGGALKVSKGSLVVMKGNKVNNLYVLQGSTVTGSADVSSSSDSDKDTTHLWHMRLGHMSERGMTNLSKRGLLCGDHTTSLDYCGHCVFGKQTRVSFSTSSHTTKGTLDYIHSDLWGLAQVPSKDDMLIAAKNMSHIQVLKRQLSDEFEMKDLGAAKKILGMEIRTDRKVGKLYLSQKSYIEKICYEFLQSLSRTMRTW
ncbi:hypothetical protein NE237_001743 [Protea cynaroides]|uniref:GAG-pre-integrase domain-containing protein n=1 Tax=Protea cynaroides TaxID=273540 RepID=A0A9Q0KTX7_9MAGN|nr:hypothetical protein NE237_001743 [Protea cynaroides]